MQWRKLVSGFPGLSFANANCLPVALLLPVLMSQSALAQEGYPLDGTWRGESGKAHNLVVVVMNWDGANINGRINPGPNIVKFTSAKLDATNWQLHAEATTKNGQPIIIDAKLENIGSYHRTLTGTWTQAGVTDQLVLTRE